jgi:hypothetical protein
MKINSPISRAVTLFIVLCTLNALWVAPSIAQKQGEGRGISLATDTKIKELPGRNKRFALVIGVDKYADTQVSTLGGASNDAKALADSLVNVAGFPADQVMLLSSNEPEERAPTRGNILRRLSNLASVLPADGLFVFAFAGHGAERGGQAFLLPRDAQLSDDIDLLEQTAINVKTVSDRIKKTGVKQVLMVLDACRNDPSGRANADNPLTQAYTKGLNFDLRNHEVNAFATLYATEVGHRAYEYKEKHQGYFTWALVEGLNGAAANDRGEVTLASLVNYLQERVPKKVLLDLGAGKVQKPFAIVEGYRADQLVLAAPGQHTVSIDGATTKTDKSALSRSENIMEAPHMYESGGSLAGTVWVGDSPQSGEYTIEFLNEGKIKYSISTGSVGGTWRQVGNAVHISIRGGYSVLEGTIDGMVMRGKGKNMEGTEWEWTLMPKTN